MDMYQKEKTVWKKVLPVTLAFAMAASGITAGAAPARPASAAVSVEQSLRLQAPGTEGIRVLSKSTDSQKDKITASQADKMALTLTDKVWVWDWVAFFVPYMSEDGVKEIIPASKKSEWAGSVDYTTGKKLKFTKKQINAARKGKSNKKLTRKDIDSHALMIMESNGDWDCVSFMFPYMSNKGIRKVVRCYNGKQGGNKKKAADYYN